MVESKNMAKNSLDKQSCKNAITAALAFFIPVAALFFSMIFGGIAPFGDNTLITDANSEWFGNFQNAYDAIMNDGSLFYNFKAGFGSSFYTKFASGLCSPFVFVAFFWGSSGLAEAYTVIALLRAGLAGLFSCLVLDKMSQHNKYFTLAASCGYSLCGFIICSMYYPASADAAVFFPLLLYGIYKYANESRLIYLFAFGTMFFITSPSMIAGGIIISIICYSSFYFRRGKGRLRIYRLSLFIAMMLCSALSAALLLIPASATSLHYGNDLFMHVDTLNIQDLLPALFFGGYGTKSSANNYFLELCGLLVLGVGAYMFNKKICLAEKLSILTGLIVIILSAVIEPVATFMFGFCGIGGTAVNMGFALAMLAAYCSVRNFDEADGIGIISLTAGVILFTIPAAASLFFWASNVLSVIAEAGFCVIFAALFIKVCIDHTSPSLKTSCIMAAFAALFGMVHSTAIIKSKACESAAKIETAASASSWTSEKTSAIEKSNKRSMGFYRTVGSDKSGNSCLVQELTSSQELKDFAQKLGTVGDSAESFTPLTQMLFGVRYIVDGRSITQTACNISPAYKTSMLSIELSDSDSPIINQNKLAKSYFGIEDMLKITLPKADAGHTSSAENEKYKWTFGSEDMIIDTYQLSVSDSDYVYIYSNECDYSFAVNEDNRSSWHGAFKGGIYHLEKDASAEDITVYVAHDKNSEMTVPEFAVISGSTLDKLEIASEQAGASYISKRGNKISFMLNDPNHANYTAITSIPYEYGWNISVNGKNIDKPRVCNGLIALELSEYENSVKLEYRPPFFRISIIITIVMLAVGLYISIYTENEITRRRKVSMAFRAVERNIYAKEWADYLKKAEMYSKTSQSVDEASENANGKLINDDFDEAEMLSIKLPSEIDNNQ